MIAGVLEVKKEISLNGCLVCVDSLPARYGNLRGHATVKHLSGAIMGPR